MLSPTLLTVVCGSENRGSHGSGETDSWVKALMRDELGYDYGVADGAIVGK